MFSPEQRLTVLKHWDTAIEPASLSLPLSVTLAQPSARSSPSTLIRAIPVGTGFSGGAVFRVDRGDRSSAMSQDSPQSSWALKAWPPTTSGPHIERIAAIVRAATPHCGLLAPPLLRADADSPFLNEYGRYWELSRWIPGSPLPARASAEAISRGGEAIARVHAAMNPSAPSNIDVPSRSNIPTKPVTAPVPRPPVPRCIIDRISRIQSVTPLLDRIVGQSRHPNELATRLAAQLTTERLGDPASAFDCGSLAKSLIQAATWLARQWPEVVPDLAARLRQHGRQCENLPSYWVLRDVHREHVLFGGNSLDGSNMVQGNLVQGNLVQGNLVQGILDYDAVDFDSPAVDLARWAGDFDALSGSPSVSDGGLSISAGSAEPSPLHAAVAGYRLIRPFSQCEWELAKTLMDVNRVGGLANWLVWLILENRRFSASAQQIQGRISHLIAPDCRTW